MQVMDQARLRKIFHESLPVELLRRLTNLNSTKLLRFINLFISCVQSDTYSQKMTNTPFAVVLDCVNKGTGNCFLDPTELTSVINKWTEDTYNVVFVDYDGLIINSLPFNDNIIVDGEDVESSLSKAHNLILFYVNKFAVSVFVNGDCIKSTPNIHSSKRTGEVRSTDKPPSQYKALILDHFNKKMNEGKSFDYWAVKKDRILRPKPEAHFRNRLLSYLQDNLTPEGRAEKEIRVGNTEDELDIRITDSSSGECEYIFIEIKWMGEARKEFKKETTSCGEKSPNEGMKQLFIYLDTEEHARCGCLLTYDARIENKGIRWNLPEAEWHNKLDKPPMRLYLKSDSASVESKKSAKQNKRKKKDKCS